METVLINFFLISGCIFIAIMIEKLFSFFDKKRENYRIYKYLYSYKYYKVYTSLVNYLQTQMKVNPYDLSIILAKNEMRTKKPYEIEKLYEKLTKKKEFSLN